MPTLESAPPLDSCTEISTHSVEWENMFPGFTNSLLKESFEYFRQHGNFNEVEEDSRVAFTLEKGKPYWELIKEDEELQDIFAGFPPELIVRAMGSSEFYLELGRQSPGSLDRLLRNQTAHIISADTTFRSKNTLEIKRLEGEKLDRFIKHPETPEKGRRALVANIISYSSVIPSEITENIELYSDDVINPLVDSYSIMGGGSANIPSRFLNLSRRLKLLNLADGRISSMLDEKSEKWKKSPSRKYARSPYSNFKAFFESDDYVSGSDTAMSVLQQVLDVDEVPVNIYLHTKKIVDAQLSDNPEEVREMTVKILEDKYKTLGKEIVRSAGRPEEIIAAVSRSELDAELARNVLRWDIQSQWGESSLSSFLDYVRALKAGNPDLLKSRYSPSGIVEVSRSESVQHTLTQDMFERAEAFYAADQQARENYDLAFAAKRPEDGHYEALMFSEVHQPTVQAINNKLDNLLESARLRSQNDTGDGYLIKYQIEKLERLREYDFDMFPRGLADLARYKNHINHELLTLLIGCAGELIPIFSHEEWEENKTRETLVELTEVIRHVVIGGIIESDPNWSKRDKQAIYELMGTRAFEPLFEKRKTGESIGMQFVPVRGLLLEASGHIADTCWAEKTNITIEHPNIDGLIFIQKGNGSGANALKENFAGAALLIRTESVPDGEPLLIIRGLNPSQSILDKVDAEDLYKEITGYVKDLAGKDGRRAAIVIDDHSGGSASNRPQIFDLLRRLHPGLTRVEVDDEDTNFNGYDITRDVYLLPAS